MNHQDSLGGASLRDALALVYQLTGNTMDPDRTELLEGRLRRRVRALGLPSISDYLQKVQSGQVDPQEEQDLIEAITTHKTSFFRTRSVWDYLEESVLANLPKSKRLRAWSAACSTGQEPYSLGMLGLHHAKNVRGSFDVLASDVSPVSVRKAEEGLYPCKQLKDAETSRPNWNPSQYFKPVDSEHVVANPELKDCIEFRTHNLFDSPQGGPFDLVLLRNVIIYFTEADKAKVILKVCDSIPAGGLLVIGESESLGDRFPSLEYISPCIYRKKN